MATPSQQGMSVRERTETVHVTGRSVTIEISRYLLVPGDDQ